MAPSMTCDAADELIALAALGVLDADDGAVLDRHIAVCARCRANALMAQRTAAALPESLDLLEAPAGLRRRLLTAVYSSAGPVQPRRRTLRDVWRRVPRSRILTALAPLAIGAATVLGVWGLTRPVSAQVETFPVQASTSLPTARGVLTFYVTRSHSVLTVAGVPTPATPGQLPNVYEIWLIPSNGGPKPVAFLSPSPSGGDWTAVVSGDLRGYRTLAATIEPPGGEAKPTGPEIFSIPLS